MEESAGTNKKSTEHDRPGESCEPPVEHQDTLSDGRFTIKLSEDMTLRNLLRSGLVEAQGRNREQIPLFVSWPNWLEDGIVCLYARDLQRVLHDTVGETAHALGRTMDIRQLDGVTPLPMAYEPLVPVDGIRPAVTPSRTPVNEAPTAIPTEKVSPAGSPGKPKNGMIMPKNPDNPVLHDSDQELADKLFTELKKKARK
jgi:hypothetical protein